MRSSTSTNPNQRLSRYRRVKVPPRMQLTKRDISILRLLLLYRYLTRRQIQQLVFPRPDERKTNSRKNIVSKRLKLLYHNKYLDRIHPPVASGQGSSPIVYCLDRKGARLMAMQLKLEVHDMPWRKRQRERGLLFLEHTLEINDFRIAVTLAVRAGGHRIIRWRDERSLRESVQRDVILEVVRDRRRPIVPDAFFTLDVDGRKPSFFLELDRGHVEGPRMRARIKAYGEYYSSGLYEQQFGAKGLRVLTVTTTDQRLENLKKWTESDKSRLLFWFTTQDLVVPNAVLRGRIWHVAGEERLHALL